MIHDLWHGVPFALSDVTPWIRKILDVLFCFCNMSAASYGSYTTGFEGGSRYHCVPVCIQRMARGAPVSVAAAIHIGLVCTEKVPVCEDVETKRPSRQHVYVHVCVENTEGKHVIAALTVPSRVPGRHAVTGRLLPNEVLKGQLLPERPQ